MATTKIKTYPYDPADDLKRTEDQAELLRDAFESGHAGYIANALGVVARARGMSQVARKSGVTREALYKSLNDEGDPTLSTVLSVMKTFDLTLSLRPGIAKVSKVRKAGTAAPVGPRAVLKKGTARAASRT